MFVGSRDPARGRALAARVGHGCRGGGHAEMLEASNFVLLCIMPGPDSVAFVEAIKPLVAGRGVCFVDMSASYTRFYTAAQARERPPSIPSLRPRLSPLSPPFGARRALPL